MFFALHSIMQIKKEEQELVENIDTICQYLEMLRKQFRTNKYKNTEDKTVLSYINLINSSVNKQNASLEEKTMLFLFKMLNYNNNLLELPAFLLKNYILKYVEFPQKSSSLVSKISNIQLGRRKSNRRASLSV